MRRAAVWVMVWCAGITVVIDVLWCHFHDAPFDYWSIPAAAAFLLMAGIIRNGDIPGSLIWPLRIAGTVCWVLSWFLDSALFATGVIIYAAAELAGGFWMKSVTNAEYAMYRNLRRSMSLRGGK